MKLLSHGSALLLACVLATSASGQDAITGTWIVHDFGGAVIDLQANGAVATGTISRPGDVMSFYDGKVTGSIVTFKAKSHVGGRENTYTGRVSGDQIFFTRSVRLLAGGINQGAGIFGSTGPMEFVAARDEASGLAVPRSLFGNWRLDVQRSTFDPPNSYKPEVADVRAFISRPGGGFVTTTITVGEEGTPNIPDFIPLKADGRDYPSYDVTSLPALLADGSPTTATMSFRMVNERTFTTSSRVGGIVIANSRMTVSQDGKTLTEVVSNVNPAGQTTSTVTVVFDRIAPTP